MEIVKEKKQRICVEYKGKELILQPGHKVYELHISKQKIYKAPLEEKKHSLMTVIKHKIFAGKLPPLDKRKRYKVIEKGDDFIQIPSYDIHKAYVNFKAVTKTIWEKTPGKHRRYWENFDMSQLVE